MKWPSTWPERYNYPTSSRSFKLDRTWYMGVKFGAVMIPAAALGVWIGGVAGEGIRTDFVEPYIEERELRIEESQLRIDALRAEIERLEAAALEAGATQ